MLYAFLIAVMSVYALPISSSFDHLNNILWTIQIMKLIMKPSPTSHLLGPDICLSILFICNKK
jgi:hypothetical protein